jgi:hypothetical protein
MQTGTIDFENSTFDISDVAETNALLVRNHGETKLIWKDVLDRAVMLRKTAVIPAVTAQGSMVEIGDVPGHGEPVFDNTLHKATVATLLTPIDWDALESGADVSLKTKTLQHDGVARFAVLAPVFLKI